MATQADWDRLGAWAVMLEPDKNIDRHTCRRTVPMQVLSLGASRTGTLAMREALEMLGYAEPYHFASVFANRKDIDMWLDAFDGKFNPKSTKKPFGRAEFDQLLGHCSAVTDAPCIIFWRELLEAYPEAKVVLVTRDEEKWLASIKKVVIGVCNPVGRYFLRYTDPGGAGRLQNLGLAWIRHFFGVQGHLSVDSVMLRARDAYRSHYAEIRKTVPADRLLEYRLGSDWKPLCNFLDKEIPDTPFPHRNDAETLELVFSVFLKGAFIASLQNIAIIGSVAMLSYAAIRWQWMVPRT